jgi:hypothetical protein
LAVEDSTYDEIEKETESIVRGIMDAFHSSMVDPFLLEGGGQQGKDVIIEQEEKEVDANGNVKIKQRLLHNPSKEELESKTLEELETDDGDDVTTMQTIRLRLNDNDLTDHAFSNFALDGVKDADEIRPTGVSGSVKKYAWYILKASGVLGVCITIFVVYRSYLRKGSSKRRYHQNNENDYDADSDEEEMSEMDMAKRRNKPTRDTFRNDDSVDM